jgi:hypothetical protein
VNIFVNIKINFIDEIVYSIDTTIFTVGLQQQVFYVDQAVKSGHAKVPHPRG